MATSLSDSHEEKVNELLSKYEGRLFLVKSNATEHLMLRLRDERTTEHQFAIYADRLMRILAEEGISHLPFSETTITTPTGAEVTGPCVQEDEAVAVSIIRAGDSLLNAVRHCNPAIAVGKILIQRNEETAEPVLYYSKLPSFIAERPVLLADPMLATGGSALCALDVLVNERHVPPENIVFMIVVAAPEGIERLCTAYPDVKVVALQIDEGLNEQKYIMPGLGDYGDRYFGTI